MRPPQLDRSGAAGGAGRCPPSPSQHRPGSARLQPAPRGRRRRRPPTRRDRARSPRRPPHGRGAAPACAANRAAPTDPPRRECARRIRDRSRRDRGDNRSASAPPSLTLPLEGGGDSVRPSLFSPSPPEGEGGVGGNAATSQSRYALKSTLPHSRWPGAARATMSDDPQTASRRCRRCPIPQIAARRCTPGPRLSPDHRQRAARWPTGRFRRAPPAPHLASWACAVRFRMAKRASPRQ